jgi:hypothetical protein
LADTPTWYKNDLYVSFYLPNTYPVGDERRIVYACDCLIWRDELERLAFWAVESRRPELKPGSEALGIAAAQLYGYV